MNWTVLEPYLPGKWLRTLAALPPGIQAQIQELRLRSGQPVTLSMPAGDGYLGRCGVTELKQPGLFICSAGELERIFLRLCEDSVYAHEEELRQGFLAGAGGLRVGVAGTAVMQGDGVQTVRQITSLCIRLPRAHPGSAGGLLPVLVGEEGLRSTLLVGEPSSGKTTLLRDAAAMLAARRFRVAVVDERGEIAGVDGLPGCDVLRGYPKPEGIRQAVRCLAPQVVVFDELGDAEEITALLDCARMGVAVIASLHGRSPEEVSRRPLVGRLVSCRVFERWVFLDGRQRPGEWHRCLEPEVVAGEIHWLAAGGAGGERVGDVLCPAAVSAGGAVTAGPAAAGGVGAAHGLFVPSLVGAVPGAGADARHGAVDAADRYAVRLG